MLHIFVLIRFLGMSAFGVYLAEDYFFAKYIQNKGWGIRISSQPAFQNSGTVKVQGFLARLTRWLLCFFMFYILLISSYLLSFISVQFPIFFCFIYSYDLSFCGCVIKVLNSRVSSPQGGCCLFYLDWTLNSDRWYRNISLIIYLNGEEWGLKPRRLTHCFPVSKKQEALSEFLVLYSQGCPMFF